MIHCEPDIKVALLQNTEETRIKLEGHFFLSQHGTISGELSARCENGRVVLANPDGEVIRRKEITLFPSDPTKTYFTVKNIQIGIDFHWQRVQEQSFRGGLLLLAHNENHFHLINLVGLEEYLASVISSEMSADAPLEFLKAQAITARSWLVAMLEKKKGQRIRQIKNEEEIRVWQDVNDHQDFDVCADDHCQRYQGITRIISEQVACAILQTHGIFLTSNDGICDARYYKCCGGLTDEFATAWEDDSLPYLSCVSDHTQKYARIASEDDAATWLLSTPDAYCNTTDQKTLRQILPSFDLETMNFYRWRVEYSRSELEDILKKKSGIDFGELLHLEPLLRGPSGRIHRLKITGSKRTVMVGKELEIRRWLAPTHLLSSAFVVTVKRDHNGRAICFLLEGGGWGHGVGLCQIGAAMMAVRGQTATDILAHYFPGAELTKRY